MIKSIQILGTSAGLPTPKQGVSSYIISYKNYDVMIDFGEGTYLAWLKNDYIWKRLKYLFITHMHPDHTGGLINFLFYKKLSNSNIPIILYGPENLKEYILMCLKNQGINLNFDYKVLPILPEIRLDDNIYVKSTDMIHKLKCYAYRFNSSNFDIMVATDTLPNKNTVNLAKDCDILIHECTFLDEDVDLAYKTKHTTVSQALDIAKEANVDRLILSHFSPNIKNDLIDKLLYKQQKCVIYNEKIMINEK